jgi:hypothetical protein
MTSLMEGTYIAILWTCLFRGLPVLFTAIWMIFLGCPDFLTNPYQHILLATQTTLG